MEWWEKILRALGFNPVKLRWWSHRRQEKARQRANVRENKRRGLSYKHKVCPGCGLTVDRQQRSCPRCERRLAGPVVSRVQRVARQLVPEGAWTHTGVFVALNVAFYLAMLLRSGGGPAALGQSILPTVIIRFGACSTPAVLDGELWRLVTANFLHFNLLHLIFNSLCLVQLGPLCEQLYSRSRFLVLYLLSGVCGFGLSTIGRWGSFGLTAGASAVVFGLISAGLVAGYVRKEPQMLAFRQGLAKWVVLGVIISVLPGIDLLAHLGGAVGGGLMAAAIRDASRRYGLWLYLELVSAAIVVGSIAMAWLSKP